MTRRNYLLFAIFSLIAVIGLHQIKPDALTNESSSLSTGVSDVPVDHVAAVNAKKDGRESSRVIVDELEPDPENTAEVLEASSITRMKSATKINNKALRSEGDQLEYRSLLQNTELHQHAYSTLTAIDHDDEQVADLKTPAATIFGSVAQVGVSEGQSRRLESIRYLKDAIAWNENPKRASAIASLKAAFVAETFQASDPDYVKKSLVGDKIEILVVLLDHAPNEAKTFIEELQNSRWQPVVDWAKSAHLNGLTVN